MSGTHKTTWPRFVVEPCNEALRLDRADLFRWEIEDSCERPAQQLTRVIIISNLRAGVSDAMFLSNVDMQGIGWLPSLKKCLRRDNISSPKFDSQEIIE